MTHLLYLGDRLTVVEDHAVPNQYVGLAVCGNQAWHVTAKPIPQKFIWQQGLHKPILLYRSNGQRVPNVATLGVDEKGIANLAADLVPGGYVRFRLHADYRKIECYLVEMTIDGPVPMPKMTVFRTHSEMSSPERWECEWPWLEELLRDFSERKSISFPGTDLTIPAL